jgi:predicted flap endonuclease-1-like 5' DNA nuclease
VVGEVTTEPGAEDDVVVGQFPSPHAVAEPGTAIDLTVSERQEVDTPAVVGHERDDAVRALREAGLVVGEEQVIDADAPAGTVVGQEPPAGTAVTPGTVVTLTVASGANPTEREARDAFDAGDGVSTSEGESARDPQAVDGIGPTYAERLREAGIDSVDALLDADPDEVAAATEASPGRVERWLDAARKLDGGTSR